MCGPENTNRPRGGALAALNPPIRSVSPQANICGDLAFHAPGSPGSITATHARLTLSEACDAKALSDLYVVIQFVSPSRSPTSSTPGPTLTCNHSSSGDLTRNACDCGLFRQFSLPTDPRVVQDEFVELSLDKPLSLEVGNEGIIGRRVSLYSRPSSGQDFVVAEGIVGFNFLSQTPSPSL